MGWAREAGFGLQEDVFDDCGFGVVGGKPGDFVAFAGAEEGDAHGGEDGDVAAEGGFLVGVDKGVTARVGVAALEKGEAGVHGDDVPGDVERVDRCGKEDLAAEEVEKALEDATERLKRDLTDEALEEQQRLIMAQRGLRQRLASLAGTD